MIPIQFLPPEKISEGFWALNGQSRVGSALFELCNLSSAFEFTAGRDVKDHVFHFHCLKKYRNWDIEALTSLSKWAYSWLFSKLVSKLPKTIDESDTKGRMKCFFLTSSAPNVQSFMSLSLLEKRDQV